MTMDRDGEGEDMMYSRIIAADKRARKAASRAGRRRAVLQALGARAWAKAGLGHQLHIPGDRATRRHLAAAGLPIVAQVERNLGDAWLERCELHQQLRHHDKTG